MNDILAGPIKIDKIKTKFKELTDVVNDKFAGLEPIINIYQNANLSYTLNIIAILPDQLNTLQEGDLPKEDPGIFPGTGNDKVYLSYKRNLVDLNTEISTDPIKARKVTISYDKNVDSKGYKLYYIGVTFTLEDIPKSQAIYVTTKQIGESLIGDDDGRGTVGTVIKPGSGLS